MQCTYYRPEDININEFRNIIGKMQYDLLRLDKSTDPLSVYYYVRSLCHEAQPIAANPKMACWGLTDPNRMDC